VRAFGLQLITRLFPSWYTLCRENGLLKTPPLAWLSVLDQDYNKVYAFHDQIMALDFTALIPGHGGPVLRDAKTLRAQSLHNWRKD
jgi:hypothetical protein